MALALALQSLEAVTRQRGQILQDMSRLKPIQHVNVKAIRTKLGTTQQTFAARFGFSINTLRHWEKANASRKDPHAPTCWSLTACRRWYRRRSASPDSFPLEQGRIRILCTYYVPRYGDLSGSAELERLERGLIVDGGAPLARLPPPPPLNSLYREDFTISVEPVSTMSPKFSNPDT
jgi:transcriptional regulator with XRE-family HTH domain